MIMDVSILKLLLLMNLLYWNLAQLLERFYALEEPQLLPFLQQEEHLHMRVPVTLQLQ